ncbi:nucleotidyltransferase family protein [Methanobrevibacter boviskoreani]|jgi:molybdenum cofactor cytidylyltransferase|uniref:nucleotidyltransferase family protein n=3 Tax=Methanobrevibacter boviskoreani TaxID=1348249 RepID=UPI00059438C9|nr:NTP transferase domain-containing protein [Methanobrevibacter boviskoreani]
MVSAVVTGAGLNSRMRSDLRSLDLPIKNKLTLPLTKVNNTQKTILELTLDNVLNSGVGECILVLGHYKDEIINSLSEEYLSKIKIVENKPHDVGLSTSLYNGLSHLKGKFALCVSGDQPTISSTTYKNMINVFFNWEDCEKSISFLRRRECGPLDNAIGLGMPFVASKNLLIPYLENTDSNLNPILREIFDRQIKFYGVKEQFDLELVNINHYTDYQFVKENLDIKNYYYYY